MTRIYIFITAALFLAGCSTTTAAIPNMPASKASCNSPEAPSNCKGNHLPPPPISDEPIANAPDSPESENEG